MVQCMEAWFLADKDSLAAYYGNNFKQNALPARPDIENIAKDDHIERPKKRDAFGCFERRIQQGAAFVRYPRAD